MNAEEQTHLAAGEGETLPPAPKPGPPVPHPPKAAASSDPAGGRAG